MPKRFVDGDSQDNSSFNDVDSWSHWVERSRRNPPVFSNGKVSRTFVIPKSDVDFLNKFGCFDGEACFVFQLDHIFVIKRKIGENEGDGPSCPLMSLF